MPILDSDMNTAKDIFEVNVFAVVALTQACAPMVIASKGKIINISSVGSRASLPWMGRSSLIRY